MIRSWVFLSEAPLFQGALIREASTAVLHFQFHQNIRMRSTHNEKFAIINSFATHSLPLKFNTQKRSCSRPRPTKTDS